jgi:hypothetical protein
MGGRSRSRRTSGRPIELDPWGSVEGLTAVRNGAYTDNAVLARKAIER